MTTKLDKGNIIAQKKIVFNAKLHTFESSYEVLQEKIKQLFKENWTSIKNRTCPKISQESLLDGKGTYHRSTDKNTLLPFLKNGWATNIAEFLEILKENKIK